MEIPSMILRQMACMLRSASPETTAQTSYTDHLTAIRVRWRPVRENEGWKHATWAILMHRILRLRVQFPYCLLVFLTEVRDVEIVVAIRGLPSSLFRN
jgi:hypothetical protein